MNNERKNRRDDGFNKRPRRNPSQKSNMSEDEIVRNWKKDTPSYKDNRPSQEDKPRYQDRRNRDSDDRPPRKTYGRREGDDRGPRNNDRRRDSRGGSDRGERRSYGNKPDGERNNRRYSDDNRRGGYEGRGRSERGGDDRRRDDRPRREGGYQGKRNDDRRGGDRDNRGYGDRNNSRPERRSYGDRDNSERRNNRYGDNNSRPERRSYGGSRDNNERGSNRYGNDNRRGGERDNRGYGDRNNSRPERRSYGDSDRKGTRGGYDKRRRDDDRGERSYGDRPKPKRGATKYDADKQLGFRDKKKRDAKPKQESKPRKETDALRLNRYIANAGICSRREADTLIEEGHITVNDNKITEMGYKVMPTDVVKFKGKKLTLENFVYLIMNKPKNTITTLSDPEGRPTVLDIMKDETEERVYPIGRLDRNTTGVLLFTNDGELAQALSHPSSQVEKIYKATLDKPLTQKDMEQLAEGIELEDGPIHVDGIAYVETEDKKTVGVEIHSGRNRIIHRMFNHLGYNVDKLDRTSFAGMDKTKLGRGKVRFLRDKEISALKQKARKANKK